MPLAETSKVAELAFPASLWAGSPLWCSMGDAGAAWGGGLSGTPFTPALRRSLMSCRVACAVGIVFLPGLAHLVPRLCWLIILHKGYVPSQGRHLGCWARAIQEKLCGGSAAQEGLIYLVSARIPQGFPVANWFGLALKSSEAKEPSVPCGGFSMSQRSPRGKSLLPQHSLSLLPCSEQQKL